MKKILVEISVGELLDKLTILEIKTKKITHKESLEKIKEEHDSLKKVMSDNLDIEKFKTFFENLKSINLKLWDIENEKRLCEKKSEFGEKFINLSRDVHFMNDKRAKLKFDINKLAGSKIEEVKEYTKY